MLEHKVWLGGGWPPRGPPNKDWIQRANFSKLNLLDDFKMNVYLVF